MEISIKKILEPGAHFEHRLIEDYTVLADVVAQLKKIGYRIVLTQGVYDLVHEGHALYLEQARSYGDILIVAVDTDEFTRKRKGPTRPVVPQEERLKMLVHLRHVDIVTLRNGHKGKKLDEDQLISIIKPDTLVISESTSDFPRSAVDKLQHVCGEVVILPPQATTSTSARIRQLSVEGADKFANMLVDKIPKMYREFLDGEGKK